MAISAQGGQPPVYPGYGQQVQGPRRGGPGMFPGQYGFRPGMPIPLQGGHPPVYPGIGGGNPWGIQQQGGDPHGPPILGEGGGGSREQLMHDMNPQARQNIHGDFAAALAALVKNGMNQTQYNNVKGGKLPGGFGGAFRGMNTDMLQRIMQHLQLQANPLMQVNGGPAPQAHYGYNGPTSMEGRGMLGAGNGHPGPVPIPVDPHPHPGPVPLPPIPVDPRNFREALARRAMGR